MGTKLNEIKKLCLIGGDGFMEVRILFCICIC